MKIVIVEDEIRIREGIEKLLLKEKGRYEIVGLAENGQQGLAIIRAQKPDLAIVDIRMPEMDGIQMLTMLREEGAPVKAIILSAYSEFAYAQQAVKLGVSEYLLKPIVVEELMQALRAIEKQMENEQKDAFEGMRRHLPELLESMTHSQSDALEEAQVGPLVKRARMLAGQAYQEGITLAEIAEKLSVTPEHLGTQIHRELGITFGTMMKALRINKAKELLLSTDMKLYEVAEAVGYQDAKYFARVFQADIGIMPLEFRRLHKSH